MTPDLSVIIPTYNEAEHIKKCLLSLLDQSKVKFEIILVDDGSTDNTKEIISQVIKSTNFLVQIKLFTQDHGGPGKARNFGAQKANGKVLVFVDADMTFAEDFLYLITKPILERKLKGTFSSHELVANWDHPIAKSWSLLRGFANGRMHPSNYPDKQPVFRAILKSEFERVGGFDPNRGYDDDWSLSEKLGYLASDVPKAKFYHYNPSRLGEIFTQSRWLAKRQYKYGIMGKLFALFRSSFPVSFIKSLFKMIKHQFVSVFVVSIIADLGIFIGILESIFSSKSSK